MNKEKNIVGIKFGRLLILEKQKRAYRGNRKRVKQLCRCDCGKLKYIFRQDILNGHVKSCGCLYVENRITTNIKHGYKHTIEYDTWIKIKQRCFNVNDKRYKDYGGRGIIVCDRWKESFVNFIKDMGERPKGFSIERIDNNGNYEPSNCKWIQNEKQAQNTRRSIIVFVNNEKICLSVAVRKYSSLHYQTVKSRIKNGMDAWDALTLTSKQVYALRGKQ